MSKTTGKRSLTKPAFALVIVSFLLSTTVSLLSLHAISRRNMREMNKVLATQIFDYISGELSGPIMTARTMANNSFLIHTLEQESQTPQDEFVANMVDYLKGIEAGLGYQGSFVISNASKNYYTRDGLSRTISVDDRQQDIWYRNFASRSVPYDLDVDTDEKDKSILTVYVNARVLDDSGKLLGVCGVGVRMTGMQELFGTFEQSFGVKIDLVDSNGMVQVDTDSSNIESVNLSDRIDGKRTGDYVYEELEGDSFAVTKYIDDLDWYLVVQSDGPNETGQYASIILLNLGLCLFVLGALVVALRINRRRTNELTSATLIDHATMLHNKRAFELDRADAQARMPDPDLVCVVADVNGLKAVNDNLGHDAGDELIRGAADCLRTCFEPYGKVYRTGGDEFCALLHASAEELERLKSELAHIVAAWSGKKVEGVSISCGYAMASEFPTLNVEELGKVADDRMYEDKDRYYARTGKKRRK